MWYLKSAFDTYQKVQDAVQSRLGEVQSAILSPVDLMKKFLGPVQGPVGRIETNNELEVLRQRIAELEAGLKKKPTKHGRTKHGRTKQGRTRQGRTKEDTRRRRKAKV